MASTEPTAPGGSDRIDKTHARPSMKSAALLLALLSIAFASCTTSRPSLTYDAVASPEVSAFYVDGLSIASLQTDSCYVSMAIPERAVIGGLGHLKVWFLYQNLQSTSLLLRPWKNLTLHVISRRSGKEYAASAMAPGR